MLSSSTSCIESTQRQRPACLISMLWWDRTPEGGVEQEAAHADAKVACKGHKEDAVVAFPVAIAHTADRKADKHQVRDRVDDLGAVYSPAARTPTPRISQALLLHTLDSSVLWVGEGSIYT